MKGLQFFARFEAHRFSWWNRYFRSRPGVASDTCFPWAHVKDSEPSQLDPVSFAQGFLHRLEHRLHSHFCFRFCDARAVHDFIDDVQLNQAASERCCNLNDKKRVNGLSIEPPTASLRTSHFALFADPARITYRVQGKLASQRDENVHSTNTLRFGYQRARFLGVMEAPKLARSLLLFLVEDSPSDVRLMREALRDTDLPVQLSVAHDGVEAIDLLETWKANVASLPDLILLDLNLPKKNGREVLMDIKNDELLKKIPVLVMTSSTDEDEISEVYNLNANCYIRKPSDLYEYERVVRAIEEFWFLTVLLPDSHNAALDPPVSWHRSGPVAESPSSSGPALQNLIG